MPSVSLALFCTMSNPPRGLHFQRPGGSEPHSEGNTARTKCSLPISPNSHAITTTSSMRPFVDLRRGHNLQPLHDIQTLGVELAGLGLVGERLQQLCGGGTSASSMNTREERMVSRCWKTPTGVILREFDPFCLSLERQVELLLICFSRGDGSDEPTGEGRKADRTNRFCSLQRERKKEVERRRERASYLQTGEQQTGLGRPTLLSTNSFPDGPQWMMYEYSLTVGHANPLDLPRWRSIHRQWQDIDDPGTIRPHIMFTMFITCTGSEAMPNELLYGEIGPIANAIQCRLSQEELGKNFNYRGKDLLAPARRAPRPFEVHVYSVSRPIAGERGALSRTIYPRQSDLWDHPISQRVSLFGPRQGHVLHARFDIDATLDVQASEIFDFEKNNQCGFDFWLRCYNCEPEDLAGFDSIALVREPPPSIFVDA
ncbi:unnamed protein product [Penicillium salamii]|nr:unnamed protein product [Penicillium salamii]CAG8391177.1 unnamed protein product [Penicillium salamii]